MVVKIKWSSISYQNCFSMSFLREIAYFKKKIKIDIFSKKNVFFLL